MLQKLLISFTLSSLISITDQFRLKSRCTKVPTASPMSPETPPSIPALTVSAQAASFVKQQNSKLASGGHQTSRFRNTKSRNSLKNATKTMDGPRNTRWGFCTGKSLIFAEQWIRLERPNQCPAWWIASQRMIGTRSFTRISCIPESFPKKGIWNCFQKSKVSGKRLN